MKKLDLGKDNISKLLFAFALPCVISSLINSVYNIVDQIFIGQGVGTLGNAATNVLFPLVIILNAIASLIGAGGAANLSLKLGEGKKDEAAKSVGQVITLTIVASIILSLLAYIFLPILIRLFGCTDNVYSYALDYGRIIVMGAPFMIFYSSLANTIRADGAPKYSMMMLVIGAIINIILDPVFIFGFNMGVKGGALATIIGQIISCGIAVRYLFKLKSVKLNRSDFKLDKNIFRILSLGLSSFITQATVLILFIFMNNVLTKFGASSIYGADIPLSVYGIISKVNSLYISTVIGISIGAQPIIGFNYGAGNKLRVQEVLKKVLIVNFSVGIIFNILFVIFPEQILGIFVKKNDVTYELCMEFGRLMCHSFILVCGLNVLEMTTSVLLQSLGKVFKATMLAFTRQIILLIPISLILSLVFNQGLYGVLYAGLIADIITFILAIFVFRSEYKILSKDRVEEQDEVVNKHKVNNKNIVITIQREYGSGGRFVGKLLADSLGINFYDKELISMTAKESGLTKDYIESQDEKKTLNYQDNNNDLIFLSEQKVVKKLAKESCVIVGRCANYTLKDNKNVLKVFIYNSEEGKVKRAIKYFGLNKKDALKTVRKINKDRNKYYKYYTNSDLNDMNNYDLCFNSDKMSVEDIANTIKLIVNK